MVIEVGGIFGILILVGDIYAILNTVQARTTLGVKAAWIAAILLLPVAGLIAWYFFGPREPRVRYPTQGSVKVFTQTAA